ncbi:MAG: AAA family ATPase [Anaerotruncus massiliensis (ex Togo et al. 2019)]
MKINRIRISDFRNIASLELELDGANVVYGDNGQGKTNFVEAVWLFTGAELPSAKDALSASGRRRRAGDGIFTPAATSMPV